MAGGKSLKIMTQSPPIISIKSPDDLKMAGHYLQTIDPIFKKIYAITGDPAPRWTGDGFSGLVNIILGQQISVAVADTLRERLYAHYGLSVHDATALTPEQCLQDDDWSSLGVSVQKSNYIRNVARAIVDGTLDLEKLSHAPTHDMIDALTAIKGIGLWSAENYALFCDGRCDLFPAGDLAIQKGMAQLWNNGDMLSEQTMRHMAEQWRPYRTVAALMIWQYHRHMAQ